MSVDRLPGVTPTNTGWPQKVQEAIAPLAVGTKFNKKYVVLYDPRFEKQELLSKYTRDPRLQISIAENVSVSLTIKRMDCLEPVIPEGGKYVLSYRKKFDPRVSGRQDCKGSHFAKSGNSGCLQYFDAFQKEG